MREVARSATGEVKNIGHREGVSQNRRPDRDVGRHLVGEPSGVGREHLGQLLGHVGMVDRFLQVVKHRQRERTALIDRPRSRVLAELVGGPIVQVEAPRVVAIGVNSHDDLFQINTSSAKSPGDWLTEWVIRGRFAGSIAPLDFHSRVARLESHIDRVDGVDLMCQFAERETRVGNPGE